MHHKQKIVVVGAGPVGSLAALYAAQRGHDVEIYELRPGKVIHTWRLAAQMRYFTFPLTYTKRGKLHGSGC